MKEQTVQVVIDLAFQLVLAATEDPDFCKRSRESRMKWVADKLRECGYPTHPVGSSWGYLDKQ